MKEKNNNVTQIRLPDDLYNYIKEQSDVNGVSQNALMITLMVLGKKIWDAKTVNCEDLIV